MIKAVAKELLMISVKTRGLFAVLVILFLASTILLLFGFKTASFIVGNLGSGIVVFGYFAYIVLVDSKKRWPGAIPDERLINIMTFKK